MQDTLITPVTLDGFTGTDRATDAEHFHHRAVAGTGSLNDIATIDVLTRYNLLRPRLAAELHARQERDQALRLVEERWEALSTAPAWLAAHHAYVVAVADARICIDIWRDRAEAAAEVRFIADGLAEIAVYERILDAGHPAVVPLPDNTRQTAQMLLANLEQAHAYRGRLTAETLAVVAG
ncbi:hypothetical protein [Streptomyces sp. NRRL B-24484]|uniref:hypothetical protein n=1 Tax=Streptomyces sp. NRRL B-24484 TaxID=1463833 RepID=UPI00069330FF|nr:hypothetical protein [Streptomyces sp. NRRL B-24484]